MKKKFLDILFLSIVLLVPGCQKDYDIPAPEEKEEQESQFPDAEYLVSATLLRSVQADEALGQALDILKDFASDISGGSFLPDISGYLATQIASGLFVGPKWEFQMYRIVYKTLDARGQEIELSGDIGFINDVSGLSHRKLSTVSLFHTMFNVDDNPESSYNTTMIYRDPVLVCRSFHNALAVYPHLQGAGVDKGKGHPFSTSEPLLKARQVVDCELAAMEFINSLQNVSLCQDYYTENYGISNGAATSLAVQYVLENDAEMKEKSDKVRLNGTYVAEGAYYYRDLILSVLRSEDGSSIVDKIKPYMMLSTIVCMFDTHPEIFSSRGIDSVYEMFSPKFLNRTVSYNGEEIDFIRYYMTGDVDVSGNNHLEKWGITAKNMVSPEMFLLSGEVNMENIKLQALLECDKSLEPLRDGWNPVSPLYIRHSHNDEFLPYDGAYLVYSNLSRDGFNENVTFKPVYLLDHTAGSMYELMTDVLFKEHLCCLD